MRADRNTIEQAYAFFHQTALFQLPGNLLRLHPVLTRRQQVHGLGPAACAAIALKIL